MLTLLTASSLNSVVYACFGIFISCLPKVTYPWQTNFRGKLSERNDGMPSMLSGNLLEEKKWVLPLARGPRPRPRPLLPVRLADGKRSISGAMLSNIVVAIDARPRNVLLLGCCRARGQFSSTSTVHRRRLDE